MRGKAASARLHLRNVGITPAYAGKSGEYGGKTHRPQDHPRVCGEKTVFRTNGPTTEGSPPRMRGKVIKQVLEMLDKRITPAYAGKSCPGVYGYGFTGDHPRVCGEKLIVILYKSL